MKSMKAVTLRAVFEAQETGTLPGYLGSTVRGILGHCIREFVCSTPQVRCFRCNNRTECLYVKCFSNTGGAAGAINPYVLYIHTKEKTKWVPSDHCTFDLTLFGEATKWADIYIHALLEMEHHGWGASRLSFRLLRVTEAEIGRLIYGNGKLWADHIKPTAVHLQERKAKRAMVAFDTPVRIVSGGKLFENLPFEVFARFLYGRLKLMKQVYELNTPTWEQEEMYQASAEIATVAQEWSDIQFSRYSMTQIHNRVDLPSKIGWVLYEGNLEKFVPILEAGKYTHVGKGTTIGFGHYEITYDE